jgi:hypothetical protein
VVCAASRGDHLHQVTDKSKSSLNLLSGIMFNFFLLGYDIEGMACDGGIEGIYDMNDMRREC